MDNNIVIFTGGSAANHLVDVFNQLISNKNCSLAYVIPISDNGGSSSELIRVVGGPGIGDIRSRLVRLIPTTGPADTERSAIRVLVNHRLSQESSVARLEWLDIVEARHVLWQDISTPKKELIRCFLNFLNMELVKRARPSSVFNFQGASIGNMFLTGARLFTGSFESAIYLLSSICTIPSNVSVLPAVNTNFTHHICAGLANGDTILGQNAISHPSEPTAFTQAPISNTPLVIEALSPAIIAADGAASAPRESTHDRSKPQLSRSISYSSHKPSDSETDAADAIEDANLPGSLPVLRKPYIIFTKPQGLNAKSAINSSTPIQVASTLRDSLHSPDNPQSSQPIQSPSQILQARISRIWYINPYGQEIRPSCNPMIPTTIASARAIIYSIGSLYTSLIPSLILRGVGGAIANLSATQCQKILILNGSTDRETSYSSDTSDVSSRDIIVPFTASEFVAAIARAGLESRGVYGREANPALGEWKDYVTHLLYVEGKGTPCVDKEELHAAGIECVRIYGQRNNSSNGDNAGMRYDSKALAGALEALIGRREHRRRNTLDRW